MFHKTKNKNKKYFCKSCLQCFSSKNVLTEHKNVSLSINGAQSVRFVTKNKKKKATIEFKNYLNKYQLHLKFMLILSLIQRVLNIMKVLIQRSQITFLAVLVTNFFLLMITLPNQQLFLEVKMLLMNLLKQFFRSMSTVKK